MKKKVFSALLGIFIVSTYFILPPITTTADSYNCLYIGDPDNPCPRSYYENCICDDIVVYG